MEENQKFSEYDTKVCIVGLGPAGIGSALTFLNSNFATDVICLDIGDSPNVRFCSILQNHSCKKEKPCQMISGFGGCSLFGAKISTFPAGSGLVDILGSKDLTQRKLSEALTRKCKRIIWKIGIYSHSEKFLQELCGY